MAQSKPPRNKTNNPSNPTTTTPTNSTTKRHHTNQPKNKMDKTKPTIHPNPHRTNNQRGRRTTSQTYFSHSNHSTPTRHNHPKPTPHKHNPTNPRNPHTHMQKQNTTSHKRTTPLKTEVFNSYQRFHANRTLSDAYFKIKQQKRQFLRAVDNENQKKFSELSNREEVTVYREIISLAFFNVSSNSRPRSLVLYTTPPNSSPGLSTTSTKPLFNNSQK